MLFGTTPIINNKYWSNSLKQIGYESETLMSEFYSINKKEDFDLYFEDILKISKFRFKYLCSEYVIFSYILKNYDIIHVPFKGLSLYDKWIKKNEIALFKKFGCKIVVLPYGGDFYQYSQIPDLSLRHVMQVNYPRAAKLEHEIKKNIEDLTIGADAIIAGLQTPGLGRWDVFPYNMVSIDIRVSDFNPERYNDHNGSNGVVKIVHSPNHRYIKGTEYLIKAVEQLKNEGLNVELILLERKSNDEVLRILAVEADIMVEQLVSGYGLSGMEGMASGLPVLSNLSDENVTRAFRRYSYLNECPILSTTPENIKGNLEMLITRPDLRKQIGRASRQFLEKYQSNKMIQFVFDKVYDKILYKKDIDLMNMFHPLNPDSYNNQIPKIEHPLFENKIPEALLNTLNK